MSTTLTVARRRLSEALNDYWASSATSAGATGGTTVVDTVLAQLVEGDDNIAQYYVLLTSGSFSGQVRRVKLTGGYTASSTTITVVAPFGGQVASAVTYELHRYHPVDVKERALHRAAEMLYPIIHLPVRTYLGGSNDSLVVDDRLVNSGFEATISGGAHPSWTNVGAGITVTAETTIVKHGGQSNKIVAGGGAAGQTTQAPAINIKELTGKTVVFEMWVYATAASTARIRLDWDGTNFENHAYHSGKDQWERQRLAITVPSTATQVKAICEAAAGGTAYFDRGFLRTGKVYRHTLPTSIITGPTSIYQQDDPEDPTGLYRPLSEDNPPIAGRQLEVVGMGYLTNPTTEAGTIEVDGHHLELLVEAAARWVNRTLSTPAGSNLRADQLSERQKWGEEIRELASKAGVRMRPQGAHKREGWHIEESGQTRYLILGEH